MDLYLIENPLQFDVNGIVKEHYNLKNLHLIPNGMTWNPYLKLQNCNTVGRQCEKSGMLVELMNSWSESYNFTLELQEDQSGSWENVFNDIVINNHPFALTYWIISSERYDQVDFIPITKDSMVLASRLESTSFDLTFFLRPFTHDTWVCICSMIVSVTIILLIPTKIIKNPSSNDSFKNIVELSLWSFFLLLNSYYSGAMTMFFANENGLPFQNVRDVMQSSWKLKFFDGNEIYFRVPANNGDPDYVEYWQKVLESPGTFNVPVKDALKTLSEPNTVLYSPHSKLSYLKAEDPTKFPQISTFGSEHQEFFYLVLPKNSPLTPIFRQASTYLFESGQFRKLFQQWTNINEKSTDVTQSVQMGQVFLVFAIIGISVMFSFIIFIFETVYFRLYSTTLKVY